jgi:hypothetical protein
LPYIIGAHVDRWDLNSDPSGDVTRKSPLFLNLFL